MEVARVTEFVATSSSIVIHHRFWKWGALILALIYVFNRVSRLLIKILVLQLHRKTADFSSSSAMAGDDSDGFCSSDDEDEDSDDECLSEDEDEKEMRDDPASISCDNLVGYRDDFLSKESEERTAQKRKFKMRRKRSLGGNMFSFGDLVNGSSVVKIWDGLGLASGLDGSNSSVSIFDLERSFKLCSFPGQVPAVSASPSAVVLTASDGAMGVSSWDVRVRRRTEWSASSGLRVEAAGVEKVHVRDDGSGKEKVWDLRNQKTPLTEYDGMLTPLVRRRK